MMRSSLILFAMIIAASITSPVYASDMSHDSMGHGAEPEHGMDKKMDHSRHRGEEFRNADVQGYRFSYHLMTIEQGLGQGLTDKELDPTKSHHLMVFINDPENNVLALSPKILFQVLGPDGEKQTAMATIMHGGSGINLNMTKKGAYQIEIVVLLKDGEKLVDKFVHQVN